MLVLEEIWRHCKYWGQYTKSTGSAHLPDYKGNPRLGQGRLSSRKAQEAPLSSSPVETLSLEVVSGRKTLSSCHLGHYTLPLLIKENPIWTWSSLNICPKKSRHVFRPPQNSENANLEKVLVGRKFANFLVGFQWICSNGSCERLPCFPDWN